MEQLINQANERLVCRNSVYRIYNVNGGAFLGDVSGAVYDGDAIEPSELLEYVEELIEDEKSCQ